MGHTENEDFELQQSFFGIAYGNDELGKLHNTVAGSAVVFDRSTDVCQFYRQCKFEHHSFHFFWDN
jgi:hypothetical protein